jgi:hypothetical protein
VPIKTPREHRRDSCDVTPEIRERHGLSAATGSGTPLVGQAMLTQSGS